jgi:hypothetical protein
MISNNVKETSIIYSDCWKGYSGMRLIFRRHMTVNHSRHFKDLKTGVHTNTIEGTWLGVKMQIPLRGRTKKNVELYLVRYMIQKNSTGHPFWELLKYLF